jgi:DNA-binding response OmpR family regulator
MGGGRMNEKIIVVEDELKIARFLELELKYEGYEVSSVHDGRSGLEAILGQQPDLVILDLMLPGMNGMEVCRRVRQSSQVPIIMLTAKDETMDKVMGLDIGADDYMTKPFAIEELLARIRRVFRDQEKAPVAASTKKLCAGDLCMDPDRHEVHCKDEPVSLTKKEFELCRLLMENQDHVLTRDQIIEQIWGYDYYGDLKIVDVYIRTLRTKIDEAYDVKFFHTVRGVGYIFKVE